MSTNPPGPDSDPLRELLELQKKEQQANEQFRQALLQQLDQLPERIAEAIVAKADRD